MKTTSSQEIFDWEEVIVEGAAEIIIPRRELFRRPDGVYEPAWAPVFYNPLMRINRDFTVLATKTYFNKHEFMFIEPLGGTGVRGVRLALESCGYGLINDVDPIAYYYIVRNIRLNRVDDRVYAVMQEANTLLNNYTFTGIPVEYIDIDPYGSPIPYIDSAIKPLAKKALIGVTATDTGPLTCSHGHKALRRYGVRCFKTDFAKELGLRILIYNIVFRAAAMDTALKPLLSYSGKYYYRVFFEAERSGVESYRVIEECRGYLWYCKNTLERGFTKEPSIGYECLDGSKPLIMGPLWICSLGSRSFLNEMRRNINQYISGETIEMINNIEPDITINNPYIRYDKLFGLHKKNQPPINKFIEFLRKHGIQAHRSHFDPRAIRVNTSIKELHEIIKSL
jgi:tRNA (guanine26-N2/guanine27-N2)-dimethyltransferase